MLRFYLKCDDPELHGISTDIPSIVAGHVIPPSTDDGQAIIIKKQNNELRIGQMKTNIY